MNSTEIAAQLREIADVYSVGSTNVIAIRKAADMISLMDGHIEDIMMRNQQLILENETLRQERDEANSLVRRIFSEINCRIENGADSNGHLEGLYGLYYKETE